MTQGTTPLGYPPGGMTGDLAIVFDSLEHISREADAIVVVDVVSIANRDLSLSTTTSATLPFTIADALIRESVDGDLNVGETITVGELGGPTRGEDKANPGQFGEYRVLAPGGVLPLAAGKSYLLFLAGPTNIGPVTGGAYAPDGGFQGKFLVKDGVIEFEGSDSLLGSSESGYAVAREIDGRKWCELKPEIEAIVKTKS